MNTNNNRANANNEANTNPTTNAAEPKPTHGAGVKNHPCADLPKPDGKKVFGEIEKYKHSPIAVGCLTPIDPMDVATPTMCWYADRILEKVETMRSDLNRVSKREIRNADNGKYLQDFVRGSFLNDLNAVIAMMRGITVPLYDMHCEYLQARKRHILWEDGERNNKFGGYPGLRADNF